MKTIAHDRRTRLELLALLGAGALLAYSCSSGLEGDDPGDTTPLERVPESTNLRFAFDPLGDLTDPVDELEVAGGVIATADGDRERPVAFVAFVTRSLLPDVETADANAVEDVFVAAVDADAIDTRAFTYAIAGKMRHTRCVTCHQMNIDVALDPQALPPTPFLTQDHPGSGLPPLNEFTQETCKDCHFHDWLAPGPTFDLRRATTEDLYARAQVPPGGLDVHFSTDPRVLWALDSGATPFGGAADDDHDGVDEPEDTDGKRRHVPGGKKAFLEQLEAWLETRDPATGQLAFSGAEAAIGDRILVSRNAAGSAAANGASTAPSLVYVPNPAFDPNDPTAVPAGELHVAFQSAGTNLVGGASPFLDVFKVVVDVGIRADGTVDLDYRGGSQVHVSEAAAGGTANGNSTDPDIGADGTRIAFVSDSHQLVAGMAASCRPEVYLWDSALGTSLVSHLPASSTMTGDAGATAPDLSPDGMAVAFESDATNLVLGDTNGTRDVFYALWPMLDVVRASVADGGGELAGHSTGGSVWHENGDVRVAFACQDVPLPPVLAVQCPDVTVSLTPDRSVYMRAGTPNNSFGSDPLFCGSTGTDGFGEARAALRFDLSGIPAGATINSASLSIQVTDVAGPGPACPSANSNTIQLRRMLQDWSESATWNDSMAAGGWAGGNASGTSSGSLGTGNTTGTKTWTSGTFPGMLTDLTAWVNGTASNFGWLLDGSNTVCTVQVFVGRASPGEPVLTIDYSPPPPRLANVAAAPGSSAVLLRDTKLDATIDLNQVVGPDGVVAPREIDVDGVTELPALATNPVIGPYGNAVLFEGMAQNLDTRRPVDENRLKDVFLADLQRLEADGFVLPYRLSVTHDGGDSNGESHSPRFAGFAPRTDVFPLGIGVYATRATNLGDSDPGDLDEDGMPENDNYMLHFLQEGGAVVASFEAEPALQGVGRGVRFENTTSGNPATFAWDFGDGATSTQESPTHAYDAPGLYTVSLSADGVLGTDDRVRTDHVEVVEAVVATFTSTKDATDAPDQDPAAGVPDTTMVVGAVDDGDPSSRLLFDLDSSGSTNHPMEWSWTLGRAGKKQRLVSEEASPTGIAIDSPGLYDLTLRAEGPGGVGTATQRIEVYQAVASSFTTSPVGTPVRGAAPLSVQFTETATGDVAPMGYFWSFGDGGFSQDEDPTHDYGEGVHLATLVVTGMGTDSSTSQPVAIIADGEITAAFNPMPLDAPSVANFTFSEGVDDGSGCEVTFANLSANQAGDPLFYFWDFGVVGFAGQERLETPTVTYDVFGSEAVTDFAVRLVASKTNPAPTSCNLQPAGTCDEQVGQIRVYPRPSVSVLSGGPSYKSAPNRPPHTVDLFGNVIGDGVGTNPEYRWYRSEPEGANASILFAEGLNVTHEFLDPGNYQIALEVETDGPGGVRQVVRSDEIDVLVSASTFTEVYSMVIDKAASGSKCVNCHSGANPPAGLLWSGTPAEVYDRIVVDDMGNVGRSRNCDTSRRLIEPGSADLSVVYNVLIRPPKPLCPIDMRVNLAGDESEKDARVAVLRSWIQSGAPEN